jgi:tRNA U38,U39,U40 pseudouridine synthase TruA
MSDVIGNRYVYQRSNGHGALLSVYRYDAGLHALEKHIKIDFERSDYYSFKIDMLCPHDEVVHENRNSDLRFDCRCDVKADPLFYSYSWNPHLPDSEVNNNLYYPMNE